MPTYRRCPKEVNDLANAILCEFETHKPLLDARVKIDFVFAIPETDEDNQPVNDALKCNGVKALGIAKIIGLKERALDRGDAEIAIDGYWWNQAGEDERRALLDHELHHLSVQKEKNGTIKTDDLRRPLIELRKHDYQFGWFKIVASRHGTWSQERIQAGIMMSSSGQLFWPEIVAQA